MLSIRCEAGSILVLHVGTLPLSKRLTSLSGLAANATMVRLMMMAAICSHAHIYALSHSGVAWSLVADYAALGSKRQCGQHYQLVCTRSQTKSTTESIGIHIYLGRILSEGIRALPRDWCSRSVGRCGTLATPFFAQAAPSLEIATNTYILRGLVPLEAQFRIEHAARASASGSQHRSISSFMYACWL